VISRKHICNSLYVAHKLKVAKVLATFVNREKEIFKNAPHAIKMKRTKRYKETLRKTATKTQHCIRAIAGVVVKSRLEHLINFCGDGQVIALKSSTALIVDRYRA